MDHLIIIATSLNSESKSQRLAQLLQSHLLSKKVSCELVDLRQLKLPFSGTAEGWSSPPDLLKLQAAVERASHVVFAVPIYCYDVNSAAKNVIELIGRSFTKKIVGFMCSAGGKGSYMSVMNFANHLMLDFRCVIAPRFLYVDKEGWTENGELQREIQGRLHTLVEDLREICINPSLLSGSV